MSVKTALLSALIAAHPVGGFANETCNDDAMIVFDGSDSMAYNGFNTVDVPRITDARSAMRNSIPQIAQYRNLGLIIYGPGRGESCGNVDLRFEPMPDASGRILDEVDNIVPGGMTALTEAVRQAAEALKYTNQAATIVLVTDGRETCGGYPCDLADQMRRDGVNVTVHVIGFKLRPDTPSFRVPNQVMPTEVTSATKCLAEKTGGKYVTAETVRELSDALQDTLGCKVYGRHPWTQMASN